MRFLFFIAFALVSAPVFAADSIADQAEQAYAMFAGGLSQQAFLSAQYGDKLLANINGNWVRLNGPDPKSGAETYGADTARFCQSQAAVTLKSDSPFTLTLTTNLKAAGGGRRGAGGAGAAGGGRAGPAAGRGARGRGPD